MQVYSVLIKRPPSRVIHVNDKLCSPAWRLVLKLLYTMKGLFDLLPESSIHLNQKTLPLAMSHNTTIKIDDNSTAAVGFEILSTKYRIKLRNVFQLDFATKRIHINMPRSSSIFFSPFLANGCSKGTLRGNKSRQLFSGHLGGIIGNKIRRYTWGCTNGLG